MGNTKKESKYEVTKGMPSQDLKDSRGSAFRVLDNTKALSCLGLENAAQGGT